MNCDLEGDLAGCAEMRAFAESLRAAPQARVDDGFADRVMAAVGAEKKPRAKWRMPPLGVVLGLAASLTVAAAYFFIHSEMSSSIRKARMELLVHCQRDDGTFSSSSAAQYMQPFAVAALAEDASAHAAALDAAVGAITRTQNADGGWANAELSARNVEALRVAADAGVAGAPTGLGESGKPESVKGFTAVVSAKFTAAGSNLAAGVRTTVDGSNGAALPADVPVPVISDVKFLPSGAVQITVENVVPYVQYTVSGGTTPSALDQKDIATGFTRESGSVKLTVANPGANRFFKVVNK